MALWHQPSHAQSGTQRLVVRGSVRRRTGFAVVLIAPSVTLRISRPSYAPDVAASSGLGLLCRQSHRGGCCPATGMLLDVGLSGDRQDRRSGAASAGHSRTDRRSLAAHLLRGLHPKFAWRGVLRIQLRAVDAMGGLWICRLSKRQARGERGQAASDHGRSQLGTLPPASVAGIGSDLAAYWRQRRRSGRAVASRALGGDRRGQWQSIILGLGASTRKAGFPSSRLLGTRGWLIGRP